MCGSSNSNNSDSTAGLYQWDFSYSSAAVDKISTDVARRMVSLRELSFFLQCFKGLASLTF